MKGRDGKNPPTNKLSGILIDLRKVGKGIIRVGLSTVKPFAVLAHRGNLKF